MIPAGAYYVHAYGVAVKGGEARPLPESLTQKILVKRRDTTVVKLDLDPKATELREAAAAVPADRILAETDSPYLAPQPLRGKRNEPANVLHTLAVLAEARGEEPAALEQAIDRNATAAFGLPAP